MKNKGNSNLIRGFVLNQEEQTKHMKNQINCYKEALKKAQENSKETEVNGKKEDSITVIKHLPQESFDDGQNLRTQTKSLNENKHNTESLIEIAKRKFRNFFLI